MAFAETWDPSLRPLILKEARRRVRITILFTLYCSPLFCLA
jgi:hypothetical protein